MKEFISKNKKSVIIAIILFSIIQIISLAPFLYNGIFYHVWDIMLYMDFLSIYTIVLLCVMLIYREIVINKIRKKTKNWVNPLSDEDKAKYKTFMNSVLYEGFINLIIYLIVYTVYMSI